MHQPGAEDALVYGLSHKARCLTAQIGDTEKNCFFVGTLSLREENELHLIQVNEIGKLEVTCVGLYTHHKEIWNISPCPSDPLVLFTCYNTGQHEFKSSLWRIEDDVNLKELVQLPSEGNTRTVLWRPSQPGSAVSLEDHALRAWELSDGYGDAKSSTSITLPQDRKLTGGCCNPNSDSEILVTSDTRVQGWDIRSSKETMTIPKAHGQAVRDLDYNPNKLYHIVTGGDDCLLKFWDTRKPAEPLKIVKGHSHWVWQVEYNRSRDQLVVSSSTDSSINLWKIGTLSSDPLGIDDDEEGAANRQNKTDYLIRSYDEHEHSVYSVAWGSDQNSPYVFASLSYDGRVVINQVPEDEIARIQEEEM